MEVKSKQETIKSLRVPIVMMFICVAMLISLAGIGLYLVEKKKQSTTDHDHQTIKTAITDVRGLQKSQDTIKMMLDNFKKQQLYGDASIRYERLASEYAIKYYRTYNDKYRILSNTYDSLKAYYAKLAYSIKIKP